MNKKQNKGYYLPTNKLPLKQRNAGARSHFMTEARSHFMTDIFGSPIELTDTIQLAKTRHIQSQHTSGSP